MKLDTKAFRYLAPEDWRVLTGVELGSKNHEVVPTPLIIQLSGLRAGSSGAARSISTLAKANLIARVQNMKYDGYRLTYGGLDYLALHSHTKSSSVIHLGSQMGVGKESDIYLVTSPDPSSTTIPSSEQPQAPIQAILKLHRLGRTSFRTIRTNRSYHGNRAHCSWQYLSRLSAHKEYLAMQALYSAGFPVPRPIAWSRHAIVMSLVPGIPLRQVPLSAFGSVKDGRDERIARLYGECMELTLKLAEVGLIHGDFNEFNILIENVPDDLDPEPEVDEDGEGEATLDTDNNTQHPTTTTAITTTTSQPHNQIPTKPMTPHLIDFPQITSISHPQASSFFLRDVDCIKRFFLKRYHFTSSDSGPTFEDATTRLNAAAAAAKSHRRLDVEIEAAGFSRKMARELGSYYDVNPVGGEDGEEGEGKGEMEETEEMEEAEESLDIEHEQEQELDHQEDQVESSLLAPESVCKAEGATTEVDSREAVNDGSSHTAGPVNSEVGRYNGTDKSSEILPGRFGLSTKHGALTKPNKAKSKAAAGWSI